MKAVIFYMAVLAVLPLAGCTSKSVETVQNKQSGNRNFTIGEILDARSFCDSGKWSDSKNDAGDTIVQYNCTAKLDSAAMESAKKTRLDQIAQLVRNYEAEIGKIEESLKDPAPATESGESTLDFNLRLALQELEKAKTRQAEKCGPTALPAINGDLFGVCDGSQVAKAEAWAQGWRDQIESGNQHLADIAAERATKKQRFEAGRAAYLSKLKEAEAEDRKALGDLFDDRSKVEQQAFFKVQGDEVSISDFKFFSDGVELGMTRSAMIPTGNGFLMFPSELASPKGPQSKADWDRWWAERIHPELKLKVAEFITTCQHNFNCSSNSAK